jgi:RNA polymerase sigma-70 factor (ECF subfamily)
MSTTVHRGLFPRAESLQPEEAETEVIRRASAGDEEAFRMLVSRHRAHAFAIALRITRSPEDAEDVVQQAFVRAWHALGQFRAESAFGTWLHRIVARRALDRAGEMKVRRDREERPMLPPFRRPIRSTLAGTSSSSGGWSG